MGERRMMLADGLGSATFFSGLEAEVEDMYCFSRLGFGAIVIVCLGLNEAR